MAQSHETGNPIVTANNPITDLLAASLGPDWSVEGLAEQVIDAIAAQRSEEAQEFIFDADATTDRQSRRLLRPLLACLATKSAAEAGTPANLYGGYFSFKRPGPKGPVWIVGQFENRPGSVRVTLRRSSMSWPEQFLAFFRKVEAPLGVILNADGCREGWLQGEFFRHFRTPESGFLVNCSYCEKRVKHDLHCHLPTEMISGLKVYDLCGYYNKNLHGRSNIKRFLPAVAGGRVFLSSSAIQKLGPAPRSYLGDVLRLQGMQASLERYMILVLRKASAVDEFGHAISAVQVSSIEHELDSREFLVRISVL